MSHSLGLLAAGVSIGSVAWVFLVQAPWLTRRLGRDAFVPVMMQIVPPLLALTGLASVVMLATSPGHHHHLLAGASLAFTLIAAAATPRALRAGGQSLREKLDEGAGHSAGRFIADGGGAASRVWHRVLGLSVVAVLGTQVAWFVVPPGHSHEGHASAPTAARHHANRETVEDVAALTRAVEAVRAAPPEHGAEATRVLRPAYETIFRRCTMTGEAHEALHDFLLPMGAMLDELDGAHDAAATRAVLKRLSARLATWPERFEG